MKKEKSKKTITISVPLILILVGGVIILSIVTSYAATTLFDSNNVNYDNTTSGIRSSNVQGAIDELYACASNYSAYDTRLTDTEDIIGNTTLSTTAPTLTGGINELNSNYNTLNTQITNRLLTKPVAFNLSIHSSITDASVNNSNCYYDTTLNLVHIEIAIISNSGLISGRNGAIASVPSSYKPKAPRRLGMATITHASASDWQPFYFEGCYIDTDGFIRLNNFIDGAANLKFIFINASYYIDM